MASVQEEAGVNPAPSNSSEIVHGDQSLTDDAKPGPIATAVDTNNNSVLIDTLNTKLSDLKLNLRCLNSRCDQFNDVKQSIRQMNDLIKDDLFMDFGSIALLLRTRLDEMCDKIKERLKDAYSVVRDTQAKLVSKLGELRQELEELERLRDEYQQTQMPAEEQTPKEENQAGEQESGEQNAQAVESEREPAVTDAEPKPPRLEQIEQKIKFARDQIDLINNELYLLICGGSTNEDPSQSQGTMLATNQILALRGSNSDSLLVENHLYPQFNYHIDTCRLVNEINNLYVQLGPSNNVNPKVYFFDDPLNENYLNARVATTDKSGDDGDDGQTNQVYKEASAHQYIISNHTFDCVVNSSLNADGTFWVQLIGGSSSAGSDDVVSDVNKIKRKQQKLNLFIEELNKYVRQKRIGDKEWHTYAEAIELGLHTPGVNEKCFCLEPKSRKWLRARLLKFDLVKQTCQVRFMDTGHMVLDDSITFSSLLLWKDFDLSKMPARVIKCVLVTESGEEEENAAEKTYEKDICLETRFLFRDLTAKKYLKCTVLEPVKAPAVAEAESSSMQASLPASADKKRGEDEEDTWFVRLHYTKDKTVNHLIHEINENEKKIVAGKDGAKNPNFRSLDIRMENGRGGEGMTTATKIIRMNVASMPAEAGAKDATEMETTAAPSAEPTEGAEDKPAEAAEAQGSLQGEKMPVEAGCDEAAASLPAQAAEDGSEEAKHVVDSATMDIDKLSLNETPSSLPLFEQHTHVSENNNLLTNVTHDKPGSSMRNNRQQDSLGALGRPNRHSLKGGQPRNGGAHAEPDYRDSNFSLPPQRHQESFEQSCKRAMSLMAQQFGGGDRHHLSQPDISSSQQPESRSKSKNPSVRGNRRRSPRRDQSPNHNSFSSSLRSQASSSTNQRQPVQQRQPFTGQYQPAEASPTTAVSGNFNTWQGPSPSPRMRRSDDPNETAARSLAADSSQNRAGAGSDRNNRNRTKPKPRGGGANANSSCQNEAGRGGQGRQRRDDDDDNNDGHFRRSNFGGGSGGKQNSYRSGGGGGSGNRNDGNKRYNNGHYNQRGSGGAGILDDFESHKRSLSSASTSLSSLLAVNQFHLSKKTPKNPKKESLVKQATSKLMSGAGPYVVMCADEEQSSSAFNDVFIDSDSMFNLNANLGRSSRTESDCDEVDDDEEGSSDDDEDDDRPDQYQDPGGGEYFAANAGNNEDFCNCDECRVSRCQDAFDEDEDGYGADDEQRRSGALDDTFVGVRVRKGTFTSEYVHAVRSRARSCCEELLFVREEWERRRSQWQTESLAQTQADDDESPNGNEEPAVNEEKSSMSAASSAKPKRKRDKSYSNDYFCLYYATREHAEEEERGGERPGKRASNPSLLLLSSNKTTSKSSIEKSRNRFDEVYESHKSRDVELIEKDSSKQEEGHKASSFSEFPASGDDEMRAKSIASHSELSIGKGKKLDDDDDDEFECLGKKSLDDWEDEADFADHAYHRLRNDCTTTTTTTEQILSNLAKVELDDEQEEGENEAKEASHGSEANRKKICEDNTTSMDTTSDLMQLEMTLDITHPVACRHASQLPLPVDGGQPNSPAGATQEREHLSRFQHHFARHRQPTSLFTLQSSSKVRSFSANAAVSSTVNSWSVDVRQERDDLRLRSRLVHEQKRTLADASPVAEEPKTEPAGRKRNSSEQRRELDEDESFESCAEEMIFLRTSTTASSSYCDDLKKEADDTDVSGPFSHEPTGAARTDQQVESSPGGDEDAFKTSFKSNKTGTSSLNTIDPLQVEDDNEDEPRLKAWAEEGGEKEKGRLDDESSFHDVREEDRQTITASVVGLKLSQSSLQGDEPAGAGQETLQAPAEPTMAAETGKEAGEQLDKSGVRTERLKKFTMAVFVDSFEDYSFNKTSSSSSSSSSSTPNTTTTNADRALATQNAAAAAAGLNKDDTVPSNGFADQISNLANTSSSLANNLSTSVIAGHLGTLGHLSSTSSTLNSSLVLVNTTSSLTANAAAVGNTSSLRLNQNDSTLGEGFVTAASINATPGAAAGESLSSTANQNASENLTSLREFELNEAKIRALGSDYGLSSNHSADSGRPAARAAGGASSSKLKASSSSNLLMDDDDVFMFQANPNIFSTPAKPAGREDADSSSSRAVVTSKPPALISNVVYSSNASTQRANAAAGQSVLNHHSYYFSNEDSPSSEASRQVSTSATTAPSNQTAAAAVAGSNGSHPSNYGYLSTITEYSNETYETCSNQSSNMNLKVRQQGHPHLHPRQSASSNSTATSLTNQNTTVPAAYVAEDSRTLVNEGAGAGGIGQLRTSQHSDEMKASVESVATTVKRLSVKESEDTDVFDHLDDSKVTVRRKARPRSTPHDATEPSSDKAAAAAPTSEYQQLVNRKVNSWLRVCNSESRERQMQQLTKSDINVYDISGADETQNLDRILTSSASVTDKLFEKFCMLANDDIMNGGEDDDHLASSSLLVASNPPRPHAAARPEAEQLDQSSSSTASFKTSLSQMNHPAVLNLDDGDDGLKVLDYKTYLKNQSSTTDKFSSLIGSTSSSSTVTSSSLSTSASSITLSSINASPGQPSGAKPEPKVQATAAALKPNRRVVLPMYQNVYLENRDSGTGDGERLPSEDNDEVFLKQEELEGLAKPAGSKKDERRKSAKRSTSAGGKEAEQRKTHRIIVPADVNDVDLCGGGSSTSLSLSIASKSESDLVPDRQGGHQHHHHHSHHHKHHLKSSNEHATSSPSALDASCNADDGCWCFNANCAVLNSTLSSGTNLSPHQSRHKHHHHHQHRHSHHHRVHRSLSRGASSLLNSNYYNQLLSSSAAANNTNGSITPVQTPQQLSSSPFGASAAHNLSTATTIEISSYTSDSLFNSHFIITPMCSDAGISPSTVTQLGSILLKSPLLPPISPSMAGGTLSSLMSPLNQASSSPAALLSNQLKQQHQQLSSQVASCPAISIGTKPTTTTAATGSDATSSKSHGVSANNMNLIAQLTASISGLAARSISSTSSSNTGVTAVPVARSVSPPLPPEPAATSGGGAESLSLSLPPPPPPIPSFLESAAGNDSRREFQLVLKSFKNRSTSSPPTARDGGSAAAAAARAVRTPPSAVITKIIESLSLQAHNGGPFSSLIAPKPAQPQQQQQQTSSGKPQAKAESTEKHSLDNPNSSTLSLPPPPSPTSLEAASALNAEDIACPDEEHHSTPVPSERTSLKETTPKSAPRESPESANRVVEEQLVAPSKLNKKSLVEVLASRLSMAEDKPKPAALPTASSISSSPSAGGRQELTDSVKPSHRFTTAAESNVNSTFKKNQDIFNKLDELNKKKLAKLSRESSISSLAESAAPAATPVVEKSNEVAKITVARLIRELTANSNAGLFQAADSGRAEPARQLGRNPQRWTSANFNSLYGLDSDEDKDPSAHLDNLTSIANEAKRQRRCNSTNSAGDCMRNAAETERPAEAIVVQQQQQARARSASASSSASAGSLPLPTPPPLLELQDEFQFGSFKQRGDDEDAYSTPLPPPPSDTLEKTSASAAIDGILTPPPSTKVDIKESVRRYTNSIIEKNRADAQPQLHESSQKKTPAAASVAAPVTPATTSSAKSASNNVHMLRNIIYNNVGQTQPAPVRVAQTTTAAAATNATASPASNKPRMSTFLKSLGSNAGEPETAATAAQRAARMTHHLPSQLIQDRLNDLVTNHGKHEISNETSPIRERVQDAAAQSRGQKVGGVYPSASPARSKPSPEPRSCYENTATLNSMQFETPSQQSGAESSFKLDHLINIHPKKLNKNSKFRCRIHDLINEHGQFWIEVVYSPQDERKFTELFRLLRACSNISQPPKYVHVGKRVSAWYKNEWHRAIILEILEPAEQINSTVRVRFIDMGITKTLKRYQDIREVDEKFFESPLKSLYCTLDLVGDMKLNREARKHFTRLIYKKTLYVKLVDSKSSTPAPANRSSAATACFSGCFSAANSNYSLHEYLNGGSSSQSAALASMPPPPPYKVLLGCPTQHGVINVYMYLLSKFNRAAYEHLKRAQTDQLPSEMTSTSFAAAETARKDYNRSSHQSVLPPMPSLASSSPQSTRHSFPPPPPALQHLIGNAAHVLPPPSPPRNPPPSPPSCAPELPPRPSPRSGLASRAGSNLFGASSLLNQNLYRPEPLNLSKILGWMGSESGARTPYQDHRLSAVYSEQQDQDETLNGGDAFSDIYDKINSVSNTNNQNARASQQQTACQTAEDLMSQESSSITERDENGDDLDTSPEQAAEDMFYDMDETTTSDSDYLFSDILNLTENSRMTTTHSEALFSQKNNEALRSRTTDCDTDYYAEVDLKKLGGGSSFAAPITSLHSSLTFQQAASQKSFTSPDPYNSIYFSNRNDKSRTNESILEDDGLDLTPVKDEETGQSFHTAAGAANNTTLNNTTFNRLANNSTFVSSERRRGTPTDQDTSRLIANASILFPPSINLSPFHLRKCMENGGQTETTRVGAFNNSYNSDTDTSSHHAPCCPVPKFKKPTASASRLKLLHNYKFEEETSYNSYSQRQQSISCIKESPQQSELNKKVKFHLN